MSYRVQVLLLGMMLCIFFPEDLLAQYTVQHQSPAGIVRNELTNLEFIVPGVTLEDVQEAVLFINFDDGVGYQQQEVLYQNGVFTTPIRVTNPSYSGMEYYFQLTLVSGVDIFFPENLPSENPVRVDIIEPEHTEPDKRSEDIDYTILSPEPGEVLAPNDVVLAVALFYDVSTLAPGEFRLLLDGRDVTALADTSDYFISYVPKGLRRGTHTFRIEYVTGEETFLVEEWDFEVVSAASIGYTGLGERTRPVGRIQLGARNQVIQGNINNAYTARSSISGSYGLFRYSLNGFFTSQESSRLQPQNRFGLNMQLGKWWRLQAGHIYPRMGQFTINGRRVFGINTEASLLWENLNLQFIYGEINRKITNLYSMVVVEEDTINAVVVDTSYTLKFEDQGRGTFQREIIGGRVAFGNEDHFQIGVQAMKVQDDTTSIFNVQNFNDLNNTLLAGINTAGSDPQRHIDKLTAQPELLQVQNGTVQPKGNFVGGADLKMGFHKNRIRLEAEGVVSALNNDIYGGALTVARADELGFELDSDVADILDRISTLIIVNENMNILPLRIKDIDSDSASADPFFPTSIIAANSELSINYPGNNFKLQYRWIGPNFSSLANSTIRKDIAGFTATDRFRMLQNRLYVTLGYEILEDNVTDTKEATTKSITYRTNLSWYPVSRDLPRVSAGIRYRTRDNGVSRFNDNIAPDLLTAAVQNFIISGTDTLVSTVPKNNVTLNLNGSITQQFELLDIIHDATLSFSNLKTTDDVFAFGDVNSSAYNFNITSRFNSIRLRSQLGLTFNNTETGSGQTDISIFGLYVGGSYFMMENKLNINGRLALTTNRSTVRSLIIDEASQEDGRPETDYFVLADDAVTNDFSTFVLQAGAQYDLNEFHSFIFNANLTNVSGNSNNDRIVQLRYVFNF